jgi:tetratricopeptide (TPR) repeat protein
MSHQFATFLVDYDPARAVKYARRETEIYTRLVASHADDSELPNALGSSYLMLGRLAAKQGHLEEASRHLHKAVEIRESLLKDDPDNVIVMRNLLMTYSRLGDLSGAPFQENTMGDTRRAVEYYRKSLALAEQLNANDPNDRLARMDLAMTLTRLGAALDGPSERAESVDALQRAVKIHESTPETVKSVRERENQALAMEYLGRRQSLAQAVPAH